MLHAGFARVDITPDLPVHLMGYEFRQEKLPPADEVLDPLHARVLVMRQGQTRQVLVSLDLCVLTADDMLPLRQAAAMAAETSAERVIVACTHTHSGPLLYGPQATGLDGYLQQLRRQLQTAVAQAAGLMYPVEASWVRAPVGLAYDRRVPAADGVGLCWNPQEFPHRLPTPAADPDCALLVLRQTNGPRRFVVFNIAAHATVLGKTSNRVSADWPGAACRLIEQWLPGARALFLQGASGHTHPWVATQEDPQGVEVVGRAAAAQVALLAEATRPAGETLDAVDDNVELSGERLPLSAWRIGAVTLVALPVELFDELGLLLKRHRPEPVLIATCSQGWTGYWPDAAAFAEGQYEVAIARQRGLQPGDGEKLMDAVAELARRLDD
jgi:hypothetical protein